MERIRFLYRSASSHSMNIEHLLKVLYLSLKGYCHIRDLHSFPTRRSSDLSEPARAQRRGGRGGRGRAGRAGSLRSEEHTSELQSLRHFVCRRVLEKKKKR